MLLLARLDTRTATIIRLIGFALVSWTVFADRHHPDRAQAVHYAYTHELAG
jgi:hypothetical protein